jgi:hypothetical protein
MRSEIVPIFSPCFCAKATRSGSRAIVPSSFMISQITPDGVEAGEPGHVHRGLGMARAHQHAAGAGAEREDMPGRRDVGGVLPGSIATATVRARSWAEMPVETPSRASIETVKAVSWREELFAAISGRPSASIRSPGSARQMSPRPWVAMKLITSGVAICAG